MKNTLTIVKKPTKLKFDKDTDANNTFLGFHYQAIKTAEDWLELYPNKNSSIYCEREDDIKILDKNNSIKFKQIKCYSDIIRLNSEEINKSILNFFLLYHKYSSQETEFLFLSTGNYSGRDTVFKDWILNQNVKNYDYSKAFALIKSNLTKYIAKLKKSEFAKLAKRKDKTNNKILTLKINNEFGEIENKIQEKSFEDFIKKIKWQFYAKDKEQEVKDALIRVKKEILKIEEFKNIPELATSRILTEIYIKSSSSVIEERKLNSELLDNIIKESEAQLKKVTKTFYINFIDDRFNKIGQLIEDKTDNILSEITIQKNKEEVLKRLNLFERRLFEEDDINKEDPILMIKSIINIRTEIQKFGIKTIEFIKLKNIVIKLKAKLDEIEEETRTKYKNIYEYASKFGNSYNPSDRDNLLNKHSNEFHECLSYLFKARNEIFAFAGVLSDEFNNIRNA